MTKKRGSRKFRTIHQYVEYPKQRISLSPCADGFAQGRLACFEYKKEEITSILKTASNSLPIACPWPLIHVNSKTKIHLKFWLSKLKFESALVKKLAFYVWYWSFKPCNLYTLKARFCWNPVTFFDKVVPSGVAKKWVFGTCGFIQ